MSFFRLLLLAAVGYLIYRFILKLLTPPTRIHSNTTATSDKPPHGHLVRCDQCATLTPPEVAIQTDNHTFCSTKCQETANRS